MVICEIMSIFAVIITNKGSTPCQALCDVMYPAPDVTQR